MKIGYNKWYRLGLCLLMIISMLFLWSTRFDELMYHTFGKKELLEIGDAQGFDINNPKFKANSYVSVSGILGNKAATLRGLRAGSFRMGRYQVRHLLGSKIYIEYDEEKYHKDFSPFKNISVKGRLTPFGPGSELDKVRKFFKEYYHRPIDDNAVLIVVDEAPRSEIRYGAFFLLSLILVLFSIFYTARSFWTKEEREED